MQQVRVRTESGAVMAGPDTVCSVMNFLSREETQLIADRKRRICVQTRARHVCLCPRVLLVLFGDKLGEVKESLAHTHPKVGAALNGDTDSVCFSLPDQVRIDMPAQEVIA